MSPKNHDGHYIHVMSGHQGTIWGQKCRQNIQLGFVNFENPYRENVKATSSLHSNRYYISQHCLPSFHAKARVIFLQRQEKQNKN